MAVGCGSMNHYRAEAEAATCLDNAARAAPNDYEIRCRRLAGLVDRGQCDEARRELDWCLARKPADPALAPLARRILQDQIKREGDFALEGQFG